MSGDAVIRWWTSPAPAERLAALRILIGSFALIYVAARFVDLQFDAQLPGKQFHPVGLARLLGAPLPAVVVGVGTAATLLALAGFVAGVWWRATAPVAALLLLWTLGYRNSWAQVFHTENLLVLHVIALACTPAADAWAIGARRRGVAAAGYGWGIKLLVALTAVTYVLAGIAKLRLAGFAWLDGDQLRNQIAVDNLRKAMMGDPVAPLATTMLAHPTLLALLSMLTIVVELGAPIALAGGRLARGWALVAWGFHVGVLLAMNILFPYPLLGVAFFPVLHVERVARVISVPREWLRRRRG